jgi:two-component system OmpR family sensor kinase
VAERALVSVRDEGPGPDPAAGERLFERFWRGEAAGGPGGRAGSGLGLSIVAAIAARHDGSVHVDGSEFTLDLPLAPGAGAGVGGVDRAGISS